MFEKHLWKSDILSKGAGRPAQETDSLETRAILIEIFVMLKFTEQPKTPGMTSKKTVLSLKGISSFAGDFVLI